jgi:hypothetical protein
MVTSSESLFASFVGRTGFQLMHVSPICRTFDRAVDQSSLLMKDCRRCHVANAMILVDSAAAAAAAAAALEDHRCKSSKGPWFLAGLDAGDWGTYRSRAVGNGRARRRAGIQVHDPKRQTIRRTNGSAFSCRCGWTGVGMPGEGVRTRPLSRLRPQV